jgi:hypothetical protein
MSSRGVVTVVLWMAALAAAVDTAIVYADWNMSRHAMEYVPWTFWPIDFLLFAVACLAAAGVPLLLRKPRFAIPFAFVAGPGLLIFIRLLPLKRRFLPWGGKASTVVLAPLVIVPLSQRGFLGLYAC